uniref:Nucleolar protein 6 n=1 Tax=Malurus cyaneus samueli TaxID=2593467 RepID=A0A8C5TKA3_9PASS
GLDAPGGSQQSGAEGQNPLPPLLPTVLWVQPRTRLALWAVSAMAGACLGPSGQGCSRSVHPLTQIEELLKEVTLKETKKKKIDAFLHEINKNSVCSICAQLTDQAWLSKDVKVPFLQVPFSVKGRFHFVPPAELKVVGSYLLGTCVKPEINVDVAVTMPREIFQDKDNLNQRYHRKRALYLSHIAQHLSKEKLFGSVKFAYMNSNHLKPILLLRPQGKDEKMVTVRIHACPDSGLFKRSRFYPSKNNVRTAWFMEQSTLKEGTHACVWLYCRCSWGRAVPVAEMAVMLGCVGVCWRCRAKDRVCFSSLSWMISTRHLKWSLWIPLDW